MPGPHYVTVLSGQNVSGAFALERNDVTIMIATPSLNPSEARLQYTETSGTAPFVFPFRPDGSGALHTVTSGIGPFVGMVPHAPTRWGRVWLASSQSDARTFTIYTMAYR